MSFTHRARVLATLSGEPTDRPPVALWRHFPGADATADGLADAVVAYQEVYDFDLVKVTAASSYPAEAWGAELVPAGNPEGTRRHVRRVVTSAEDWRAIHPLPADHGAFGRELRALERVRAAVGPDVHVLATIFSPLTVAKQMVGDGVLDHVRAHPAEVRDALRAIADTTARFAAACLAHGADGIFLAVQLARRDLVTPDEFNAFGVAYDLPVVEAVRGRGALLLLHLCGEQVMFDLVDAYRPDIVNWHDRTTPPSLAEAAARRPALTLLGGLDRSADLSTGTPADVAAATRRAVEQAGGRRLIVGAGCVTFVDTPPANLRAVRDAVEPAP